MKYFLFQKPLFWHETKFMSSVSQLVNILQPTAKKTLNNWSSGVLGLKFLTWAYVSWPHVVSLSLRNEPEIIRFSENGVLSKRLVGWILTSSHSQQKNLPTVQKSETKDTKNIALIFKMWWPGWEELSGWFVLLLCRKLREEKKLFQLWPSEKTLTLRRAALENNWLSIWFR